MKKTVSFLVPLVGLVLLTALAATGGLGTERAEAASRPGLTYGGSTSQQADVFLRKSRNRRQLVRLSVDWFAPASRCTNGREYSSSTLLDPESSGRIRHPPARQVQQEGRLRGPGPRGVVQGGIQHQREIPRQARSRRLPGPRHRAKSCRRGHQPM